MRNILRIITAALVLAAVGLVPAAASADGVPLTGAISPATVSPGATVTVTYVSDGTMWVCDDEGPVITDDVFYTYADRPLVFGLFPTSVALDAEGHWPVAWYDGTTPLSDLGFVSVPGILPTSAYNSLVTQLSGWQGTFTGQVTLPTALPPGTYNAVWGCGMTDTEHYDTGAPGLLQQLTVTGTPAPNGIALSLSSSVGQNVRDGGVSVPVSGSGLQPGAPYAVVLRSDPVQIGSGVVNAFGAFAASYPVPPNTPAGAHSVTVTSVNAAGQPVSAVTYFAVNDAGTVTAASDDGPIVPSFTG